MPPLRPASATVIPPFFVSSAIYCLRWFGRCPPPAPPFGAFKFQKTPLLQEAFLALLDELTNLLTALAADLFVKRGTVLVADGLSALLSPELTALAADLLVETHAPFVANALAALAASLRDRHPALRATDLDHLKARSLTRAPVRGALRHPEPEHRCSRASPPPLPAPPRPSCLPR